MHVTDHSPDIASSLLAERGAAWLDAVVERHSRRRFDRQACDPAALDDLDAICANFAPHADARVALIRSPRTDVFRGVVGSYGKVTGAPHLLTVIADEHSAASHAHAGYVGEAVILEATALGLDTCWVGGFFNPRRVARMMPLLPGERVMAVSPVGYASDHLGVSERSLRAFAGSHERKPLEVVAPGIDDAWPAWARAAVSAARLAPSAMNRQPWRFRMEDGALVVARDSARETPLVTKALDCGIAMLHAELGARGAGVRGGWTDCHRGLDVARFEHDRPSGPILGS